MNWVFLESKEYVYVLKLTDSEKQAIVFIVEKHNNENLSEEFIARQYCGHKSVSIHGFGENRASIQTPDCVTEDMLIRLCMKGLLTRTQPGHFSINQDAYDYVGHLDSGKFPFVLDESKLA